MSSRVDGFWIASKRLTFQFLTGSSRDPTTYGFLAQVGVSLGRHFGGDLDPRRVSILSVTMLITGGVLWPCELADPETVLASSGLAGQRSICLRISSPTEQIHTVQ